VKVWVVDGSLSLPAIHLTDRPTMLALRYVIGRWARKGVGLTGSKFRRYHSFGLSARGALTYQWDVEEVERLPTLLVTQFIFFSLNSH